MERNNSSKSKKSKIVALFLADLRISATHFSVSHEIRHISADGQTLDLSILSARTEAYEASQYERWNTIHIFETDVCIFAHSHQFHYVRKNDPRIRHVRNSLSAYLSSCFQPQIKSSPATQFSGTRDTYIYPQNKYHHHEAL